MKLLAVMLFTAALVLLSCQQKKQDNQPNPRQKTDLLPGEVWNPRWPQPIITARRDSVCSNDIRCPFRNDECVSLAFQVQKDTTYFLTVLYFNGDTLHPSCRACGTVYQDTTVIMNLVTACPTGGPWVTFARLVPHVNYAIVACLQKCPEMEKCDCGKEKATADAVVSMRRLF